MTNMCARVDVRLMQISHHYAHFSHVVASHFAQRFLLFDAMGVQRGVAYMSVCGQRFAWSGVNLVQNRT